MGVLQQVLILLVCRVPDLLLLHKRHLVASPLFWAGLDNAAHGLLAFILCFIAANGSLSGLLALKTTAFALFPASSSTSSNSNSTNSNASSNSNSNSNSNSSSSSSSASSASSSYQPHTAVNLSHLHPSTPVGVLAMIQAPFVFLASPRAKVLFAGPVGLAILSAFLGCAMDLDHFITARSMRIQDATSLPRRPFAHSVTFAVAFAIAAYMVPTILQRIHRQPQSDLPTQLFGVVLVAMLSHQIRDGSRRGLWVPPFGETAPLPLIVYLGLELLLPVVMRPIFARRISIAAPLMTSV
ncbi:hypothetical protein CAOG_005662 [Capsaspora owczarzaki ATCC 30864]|uniref:Transmembrane protein 267 n=1 Tax=Capsaspora owczarzaki (strain ATCC 30864) TaxID=595528 RepID=A0A0D2WSK9_CAPO3|nr:hypothetical protein CAOG_005662 [Capsaspora owczarzaki ATCC 30864]